MSLTVRVTDPHLPAATALLQASHALMQAMFSPEENHFLSIDELCGPEITFFTASNGAQMLGCAALAARPAYGEIKSMFVSDAARGQGVGAALIARLIQEARAQGLADLKLETGTGLDSALRLYERHGFRRCGPFGDYEANQTSIFMTCKLD